MAKDILNLSDDEFLNIDPSEFEDEEEDNATDSSSTDSTDTDDDTEDDVDIEKDTDTDTDDDDNDDLDEAANLENDKDDSDSDSSKDSNTSSDDSTKDEDTQDKDDKAVNKPKPGYSTELSAEQLIDVGRKIMAEFKANGTMIKVKSAEDAIQLMQMGANYHKKMSGLKPSLKALKLLENNGLLDTEKINYLIDLNQKKPEAIKKLLKDSNIDPMEIDLESDNVYSPSKRTVNDTELVLDDVLDSIQHSPKYNETLNVLGNKWDDVSKSAIASNPEIIRVINAHMENGIYEQVASAVEYERSLGKLTGMSDLDAYQHIGGYMHENNLFKVSGVEQPKAPEPAPKNETNSDQEELRKNRKKAASPSVQRKAPESATDNYNPLAMSDEEFIKLNKLNL